MEYSISQIVYLLITGLGVGFASGLLGVGGCFIMVPVQFWLLKSIGISTDIAIKVAFGTNLAVVFPTAISGALAHSKKGKVLWKMAIYMGISGTIGAIFGGFLAAHTPGKFLKFIFGLAILLGAIRMLTAKPIKIEPTKDYQKFSYSFLIWGFILGIVSGIIGIGGGVLIIPVMVVFLKIPIHFAIGTSTAFMIFASVGGILSYIINGLKVENLPSFSLGYVNLLQFVLLALTSIPMAKFGAKITHKLPSKQLRYLFIAVMIYMSLKMMGIFTLLHLPI